MAFPLQSVCIPAYNHEQYILACLQSVVGQTYPNLELILVDDGSRDRTFGLATEFLDRHRQRFTRVELHRQANQGLTKTCNRLLSLAKGEWLHILASDDLLYPRKVELVWEAVKFSQSPDVALVHGDMDEIDAEGQVTRIHNQGRPPAGLQHKAYEQLLISNFVYAPTASIRRSALEEIGGFDTSLAFEDLDCWLRLSVRHPILRIPEVVAGYRIHGANLSQRKDHLLAAHLETHGKFLEHYGEVVAADAQKKCFRKDLHRTYRWAKRRSPGKLPFIAGLVMRTLVFHPKPTHFSQLAGWIRSTLD